MSKTVLIIQARNNSTRLPYKVTKEINNKTTLEYLIERVKKCKNLDDIIICTTIHDIDNSICNICEKLKIKYYRGDENNVLSRYYESALITSASIIVRVTGDCILIDPKIIDNIIYEFKINPCDFMDTVYYGEGKGSVAGFPDGSNPEIFTFQSLEKANLNAITKDEKEHVTGYIIKNMNCKKYSIPINIDNYSNINFRTLHLSLDTQDDLILIENILKNLYFNNPDFTIYDVLDFLNYNIKIK